MCEEVIAPLRDYLHHVKDFQVLEEDSKLYNLDELYGIFREEGNFIIVQSKLNKNSQVSLYAINHKNKEIIAEDNWDKGKCTIVSEYNYNHIKAYVFPIKELIPFYESNLISLITCFKLEHEVNYYLSEKLISYEDIIEKQMTK